MVCGVRAIYGIVLVMRAITTSVATKDPTSPTLYIVCPYLVSAEMWKSRGDFLLALDHCEVVIFLLLHCCIAINATIHSIACDSGRQE